MRFLLFFLPLSLLSSQNQGVKTSQTQEIKMLKEVSFFEQILSVPEISKCLKSKEIHSLSDQDLQVCVESVDLEANKDLLSDIFLNETQIQTLPNKEKSQEIKKSFTKKLRQELLGSTISDEKQLAQKFADLKLSPLQLNQVYARQLEKNKVLYFSKYCLHQEITKTKSKGAKTSDELLETVKEEVLKDSEYIQKKLSVCRKKLVDDKNICLNSSGSNFDGCLVQKKMSSYNRAIEKIKKDNEHLKKLFQDSTAGKSLTTTQLEDATNFASQEILELMDLEAQLSPSTTLALKECEEENPKDCPDYLNEVNLAKAKLKIKLEKKYKKESLKNLTKDKVIEIIKKNLELSEESLKELEKLDEKALVSKMSDYYEAREKNLLKSLEGKFITTKNKKVIDPKKEALITKSLVRFSNIYNFLIRENGEMLKDREQKMSKNPAEEDQYLYNLKKGQDSKKIEGGFFQAL